MRRAGVPYDRLLAIARRHARRPDEAEDLVQAACLAALASGRRDFGDDRVLAWLAGTLRNLAAMEARGAMRRRLREGEYARRAEVTLAPDWPLPDPAGLPPMLARTARLIAAGCTRDELRWLLGIPDTALRQRLAALRRLARTAEVPPVPASADGRARAALLGPMRRLATARLGTADPDGHFLAVGPSHPARARQQRTGTHQEDATCLDNAGSETSSTGSPTSIGPRPSTATSSG